MWWVRYGDRMVGVRFELWGLNFWGMNFVACFVDVLSFLLLSIVEGKLVLAQT